MVVKSFFIKGNIKQGGGFVEVRIAEQCASLDQGVWTIKIGSFVASVKERVDVLCGITLSLLCQYHINSQAGNQTLLYKPVVVHCVHISTTKAKQRLEVMSEMNHKLHFESGSNVIRLGLQNLETDKPLEIDADIYATLIVERVK